MKKALYFVAVALVLTWIFTFFVWHAGRGIHVLLLLAVICWLQAILTIPQKKYILRDVKTNELPPENEG